LNPALYPFQSLSNYLKDMKIFVCPADRTRTACTSYTTFTRTNLSYLANLSAIPNRTVTILTGDRHLEVSGQPVQVGVIALASNDTVHWTKELHASGKKTRGQLGFADGHVETVMDASLAKVFQRQNLATNLLAIP
jgi:prepilin-type processing-associated H-X9-DG protein